MRIEDYIIQNKIEELYDDINDSIFISLLLILHLSGEVFHKEGKRNPWEIVLLNEEGNYISSIEKAFMSIEMPLPLVHYLIKENKEIRIKEKVLQQLILLLSDISKENSSLVWIYENYIQKKMLQYRKSNSGDFYTSKTLAQCLIALLEPKEKTIYDPCCGSATLLLEAQKYSEKELQLFGQTNDQTSYLISQMNLILNGTYANLGEKPASTLLEDLHKDMKFDYIVANPPFNTKNWYEYEDEPAFYDTRWPFGLPPRSNANFAWLQHIIHHLNALGSACVILPNSTLTTETVKEARIREAIIRNHLLEAIITLPRGLFYSTKVPCCIWLLTKELKKKDEVLLIDATKMTPTIKKEITPVHITLWKEVIKKQREGTLEKKNTWYHRVSTEELEQNEFLLSPNLYRNIPRQKPSEIKKNHEKLVARINEILTLPIDENLHSSLKLWKEEKCATSWEKVELLELYKVYGGVTKNKEFFGKGYPLLDVKTALHSFYVPDEITAYVDVTETEKRQYDIRCGDIFLNRTSETLEQLACCSVALKDHEAVYSGFIKRLRPRSDKKIDPLYAACYFHSQIYRWEVEKVSTVYTTKASMNNKKLSQIAVYLPDSTTQKKIGSTIFQIIKLENQSIEDSYKKLLEDCRKLLIEQYITYPIMCIEEKGGDRNETN